MDNASDEAPTLEQPNLESVSENAEPDGVMNELANGAAGDGPDVCNCPHPDEYITLNVDNKCFLIKKELITAHPNTTLGTMFGSRAQWLRPNERGEYMVAQGISRRVFGAILEYYKHGYMICPPYVSVGEFKKACDYLLIPFNINTVRCQKMGIVFQELSKDGAHQEFEKLLSLVILPVMAKSAQLGYRECQLVVLLDNDSVHWDKDCNLRMGDEYFQSARSTALHYFLNYSENIELAKQIMNDRGLKRVQFGFEFFPKDEEQFRQNPRGRNERACGQIRRHCLHVTWERNNATAQNMGSQINFQAAIGNLIAMLPRRWVQRSRSIANEPH